MERHTTSGSHLYRTDAFCFSRLRYEFSASRSEALQRTGPLWASLWKWQGRAGLTFTNMAHYTVYKTTARCVGRIWLFYLSRRLVEALEELAPAAIDKVPMRIEDISGNLVSDTYFVADVVAHYAAIDWANSQVLYARIGNNPPVPSPSFTRMIPDLPKSLVVFRDNFKRSSVYITRDAKDVLGRMKPKLRGVEFGGA